MKTNFIKFFIFSFFIFSCDTFYAMKRTASGIIKEANQCCICQAVTNLDIDLVKELISQGHDLNHINENGQSPLHIAVASGNAELVKVLVDAGACVNQKEVGCDDDTPLTIATYLGYTDIVKLLLEAEADPDAVDSYGESSLHKALLDDWHDILILLLQAQVDINKQNSMRKTPIEIAAGINNEDSHPEIVRALIAYGAMPNEQTLRSALEKDTINGLNTVKILLAAGVMPNTEPLIVNWRENKYQNFEIVYQMIEILLQSGADPNQQDESGNTLLMLAARNNKYDIVNLLINQFQADYSLTNNLGQSALMFAVYNNDIPIVKILIQAGDRPSKLTRQISPLMIAIYNNNVEMLKVLLEAPGIDINEGYETIRISPLMLAAYFGVGQIVELLIQKGANVKLKYFSGQTALDLAKERLNLLSQVDDISGSQIPKVIRSGRRLDFCIISQTSKCNVSYQSEHNKVLQGRYRSVIYRLNKALQSARQVDDCSDSD